MLEPFIWMFKIKFLKTIGKILLCQAAIFIILPILGFVVSKYFALDYAMGAALVLALIIPIFILQGFFWEMTQGIINRSRDEIILSDIYDGKFRTKIVLSVPNFQPIRFLWRGIAAFVAMNIMFMPYHLFLFIIKLRGCCLPGYVPYTACLGMLLFLFLLAIPGLLWNYAERNSVVAGLNFGKAFYLMESYPIKYFKAAILSILLYLSDAALITCFLSISKSLDFSALLAAIPILLAVLIMFFKHIYNLYVYAYLLGTIAPPSEI